MNDKIIIICDMDVRYAKRLVERMLKESCFSGSVRYKLQVFDSLDAVLEYSESTPVSVFILSEAFLLGEDKGDMYARLKEARIPHIYLLKENNDNKQREYPCFYKYQASSVLIKRIEEAIAGGNAAKEVLADDDVKILGFFSPSGSVEKTTFAYMAGLLLSKRKSALYINLERYSGFEALLGIKSEKSMTEAIFYLLREDNVPAGIITDIFEEYEGLYYLPPISRAAEFEGLKPEMLSECISRLKTILQEERLMQRLIILDFSGAVQGYLELIRQCDSLYVMEREDSVSKRAAEDFYEELSMYDRSLSERLRVINIPVINELAEGEFIETRAGREFEAMVQNALKKEGLIEGGAKKPADRGAW